MVFHALSRTYSLRGRVLRILVNKLQNVAQMSDVRLSPVMTRPASVGGKKRRLSVEAKNYAIIGVTIWHQLTLQAPDPAGC